MRRANSPSPQLSCLALAILAIGTTAAAWGCADTHGAGDAGHVEDARPRADAWVIDTITDPADGSRPPDADPGRRPDAHVEPAGCEPMHARLDRCGPVCDDIDGAFWDGTRCVPTSCNCDGADCGVYATPEACQEAHAGCDSTLCTSTGGRWFARPQFCGHFACGVPAVGPCATVVPACDCGAYGVFVEDVGCMPGPLCELRPTLAEDELCAESGGSWRESICGHATCGRLSDADCDSPGCVCGTYETFDPDRGCIVSPECDARVAGEDCSVTGLCTPDAVCCPGGGPAGPMICAHPICDDPAGPCGPPRP